MKDKAPGISGGVVKRASLLSIVALISISVLSGELAAQYVHNDVKSGKRKIRTVLILPPSASLLKTGMKGGEPLVNESRTLESGLSKVVKEILLDKGCAIASDSFSPDVLDRDPDLKYALTDLQTKYDKLRVLMRKKPGGVRTGRFSLGDEVVNFSPGASADALVFVRASGVLPTTGLRTFVTLTGMGFPHNRVVLDIAVADAQSGTILYFLKTTSGGNFIADPEEMKDPIDEKFQDFTSAKKSGK